MCTAVWCVQYDASFGAKVTAYFEALLNFLTKTFGAFAISLSLLLRLLLLMAKEKRRSCLRSFVASRDRRGPPVWLWTFLCFLLLGGGESATFFVTCFGAGGLCFLEKRLFSTRLIFLDFPLFSNKTCHNKNRTFFHASATATSGPKSKKVGGLCSIAFAFQVGRRQTFFVPAGLRIASTTTVISCVKCNRINFKKKKKKKTN